MQAPAAPQTAVAMAETPAVGIAEIVAKMTALETKVNVNIVAAACSDRSTRTHWIHSGFHGFHGINGIYVIHGIHGIH